MSPMGRIGPIRSHARAEPVARSLNHFRFSGFRRYGFRRLAFPGSRFRSCFYGFQVPFFSPRGTGTGRSCRPACQACCNARPPSSGRCRRCRLGENPRADRRTRRTPVCRSQLPSGIIFFVKILRRIREKGRCRCIARHSLVAAGGVYCNLPALADRWNNAVY